MAKTYEDVRRRIAAQAQSGYNDMVRNGGVDGQLLPEIPPDGEQASDMAPPPIVTPTPPAPEPAVEETAPKKYAGKYDDVPNLEQGYIHLQQMTGRITDENKQLKEQIARLSGLPGSTGGSPHVPGPTPGSAPRVDPNERSVLDWMKNDAVVKLAETQGIDPMPLAEVLHNVALEAEHRAEAKLEQRLAPMQALTAAQTRFNALHPEALQFNAELIAYGETMPQEQKETAQALLESGRAFAMLEYVYGNFVRDRQVVAQAEIKANSKAADQERVAQRAAAGLPPSASPATPISTANAQDQAPSKAELKDLADRARAGDRQARLLLNRVTWGRLMHPSIRTWEHQP